MNIRIIVIDIMGENMDSVIIVRMLGTFEFEYNQDVLRYDDIHSTMVVKLLSQLILHRYEDLNKWTLASYLFGGSIHSQINSIKSLIWRTEKFTNDIFPNLKLISHEADRYFINPSIKIVTDYDQIFSFHKQMQTSSEKEILAQKVIMLYKGDFLPMIESELYQIEINRRITKAVFEALYELIIINENSLTRIKTYLDHIKSKDKDKVIQGAVIHKLGQQSRYDLQDKIFNYFNENSQNEDTAIETTPYYFARLCQLAHRKRHLPRNQYILRIQYKQQQLSDNKLKKCIIQSIRKDACITQFKKDEYFILLSVQTESLINVISKLSEIVEGFSCEYHSVSELTAL